MSSDSKALLKWFKEMGMEYYTHSESINRFEEEPVKPLIPELFEKPLPKAANFKSQFPLSIEARKQADESLDLATLEQKVKSFSGLDIQKIAQNTVFRDGTLPKDQPSFMLIGEAPGAQEDLEGRPFCGASGQLLDKMVACIGLARDVNLYISNVVFWRPPGNRKPTTEEIETCLPFVEKHIALVNPSFLLLSGATAVSALLKGKDNISKQRSKIHSYYNPYCAKPIDCAVIFHPSYLLRQPSQKAVMWQDLLFIKKYLHSKS